MIHQEGEHRFAAFSHAIHLVPPPDRILGDIGGPLAWFPPFLGIPFAHAQSRVARTRARAGDAGETSRETSCKRIKIGRRAVTSRRIRGMNMRVRNAHEDTPEQGPLMLGASPQALVEPLTSSLLCRFSSLPSSILSLSSVRNFNNLGKSAAQPL
jgi:hypothetical protein